MLFGKGGSLLAGPSRHADPGQLRTRRRPGWLFLDEATSACDPATEARLYGLLAERLPGTMVVSVGHRASLSAHHGRTVTVGTDGDGVAQLAGC
ncbi:hypothetical protein [Azospirillum formosense]|uniref:hypothetical protein n=1 Tax=Azospirillum formosense TaxID=861533 RepID=UPI0033900827